MNMDDIGYKGRRLHVISSTKKNLTHDKHHYEPTWLLSCFIT